MQKSALAVAVLILVSVLALTLGYSQEEMSVVENDDYEDPQRPAARFQHDAHNESAAIEECNACHHLYADGKLVEDESSEDQRCSDCHGPGDEDRQPGLTKAFHRNCKGCHLQQGAGPIMCGECHVK